MLPRSEADEPERGLGAGRQTLNAALDHRHTYISDGNFLVRTLRGVDRALHPDGVAAFVFGDVADPGKAPLALAAKIWSDLRDKSNLVLELIEDQLPR